MGQSGGEAATLEYNREKYGLPVNGKRSYNSTYYIQITLTINYYNPRKQVRYKVTLTTEGFFVPVRRTILYKIIKY